MYLIIISDENKQFFQRKPRIPPFDDIDLVCGPQAKIYQTGHPGNSVIRKCGCMNRHTVYG